MNERMEAALKLAGDEIFNKEAEGIQTAEEFQKLFAKHGVELTVEEVEEMCETIAKSQESGELNEDELKNVAGGSFILGFTIGVAVGMAAGYVYSKKRSRGASGGGSW